MNMKQWLNSLVESDVKKAMPVLSFPSVSLLDITVNELISSSELQAKGMHLISQRCDTSAAVSMMDLSVEAEAFGADIKFSDDEVPTVIGQLIDTEEDANNLIIPQVGTGRTGIYIDAIKQACELIKDKPVFAGVIGSYSLSGRLMDMTEIMCKCYTDPDIVHTVLDKTTTFLINYIKSYKEVGANGVVIAEPAAGLLSPDLISEFSEPYIKRIIDELQSDDFIVIYHNCGNTIPLIDSILSVGAAAYHFGNSIDMSEILKLIPESIPVMGNIDPSSQFRNGTPESIRENTLEVLDKCSKYKNFIISSGCDIPPASPWKNIDSFFDAVNVFYNENVTVY